MLNSNPQTVKKIAHYAKENNKKVMLNFNTQYIINQQFDQI